MKKFNWQVFISLNLFFTFLLMLLSGLILYLKPEGTVARWLDWKMLGVEKSGWESMHTVFSFLFMAFALFHMLKVHLLNLSSYFFNNRSGRKRELYGSLAITVVFLVGTVFYLPPFDWIYQGGNALSDQWAKEVVVKNESIEPRQSILKVGSALGLDRKELQKWKKQEGMGTLSLEGSLVKNAPRVGLTPYTLYKKLKDFPGHDGDTGSQHIYKTITLEEMAAILDVETATIRNYLTDRYELSNLPEQTSLYRVSEMTDVSPSQIKTQMVRALD
jgi:hypothetical protein